MRLTITSECVCFRSGRIFVLYRACRHIQPSVSLSFLIFLDVVSHARDRLCRSLHCLSSDCSVTSTATLHSTFWSKAPSVSMRRNMCIFLSQKTGRRRVAMLFLPRWTLLQTQKELNHSPLHVARGRLAECRMDSHALLLRMIANSSV